MVEELCKLGANKEVRDKKGRTALMAFSEVRMQNLALQLLLNGYKVNKEVSDSGPVEAEGGEIKLYENDLLFSVLSKDFYLLELLLAFGLNLESEKLSNDLKHLTLKQWEKKKSDWNLNYIYLLLDKFGELDREEDKELAAQVPNRPELKLKQHSKNLRQFLAEKNASDSVKRRFCRILLEEQQFAELKEILAPSVEERLEILEEIYEEAVAEENKFGPVPKSKSFRLLSYTVIAFIKIFIIIIIIVIYT